MKKSLVGLVGVLGLVAVLGTSGCGSDDSSGTSAAIASCNAYCDAYITATCTDPNYTTAAECKSSECTPPSGVTQACSNAAKAFYDCRKAQPDLCGDTGCTAEITAIVSACPTT